MNPHFFLNPVKHQVPINRLIISLLYPLVHSRRTLMVGATTGVVVITQTYHMKKETYIKLVDEVAHRISQHADIVMNVEQVAKYLGLSIAAVRKRCQRKQLPFHRNAKHLYFSKMEVDAVLLNLTTK